MLSNGWTSYQVFRTAFVNSWTGYPNDYTACENYRTGNANDCTACENFRTGWHRWMNVFTINFMRSNCRKSRTDMLSFRTNGQSRSDSRLSRFERIVNCSDVIKYWLPTKYSSLLNRNLVQRLLLIKSKPRITCEGQVVIIYLCRVECLLPLYCTKTRMQLFSSSFACCQIVPYIFSFDGEFDAANITIPRTIPFLVLL